MLHFCGGKIVKISTGEPPASNYLRPALLKDTVQKVNGTIVECNTAYGGSRASNAMHKQVVKDHGFLDIADFDLLDEDGSMSIPVSGGQRLTEDYVGTHFKNYDSYLVISHFKGHAMARFGGAIKNLSIGFGSGTASGKSGKAWIHSGGTNTRNPWGGKQDAFLESIADAAKGVCNYMNGGKNIAFINVLNRLSVDCDCDGNPAELDMHDIGILASLDPLAIDQAAIDLVYKAPNSARIYLYLVLFRFAAQADFLVLGFGNRDWLDDFGFCEELDSSCGGKNRTESARICRFDFCERTGNCLAALHVRNDSNLCGFFTQRNQRRFSCRVYDELDST